MAFQSGFNSGFNMMASAFNQRDRNSLLQENLKLAKAEAARARAADATAQQRSENDFAWETATPYRVPTEDGRITLDPSFDDDLAAGKGEAVDLAIATINADPNRNKDFTVTDLRLNDKGNYELTASKGGEAVDLNQLDRPGGSPGETIELDPQKMGRILRANFRRHILPNNSQASPSRFKTMNDVTQAYLSLQELKLAGGKLPPAQVEELEQALVTVAQAKKTEGNIGPEAELANIAANGDPGTDEYNEAVMSVAGDLLGGEARGSAGGGGSIADTPQTLGDKARLAGKTLKRAVQHDLGLDGGLAPAIDFTPSPPQLNQTPVPGDNPATRNLNERARLQQDGAIVADGSVPTIPETNVGATLETQGNPTLPRQPIHEDSIQPPSQFTANVPGQGNVTGTAEQIQAATQAATPPSATAAPFEDPNATPAAAQAAGAPLADAASYKAPDLKSIQAEFNGETGVDYEKVSKRAAAAIRQIAPESPEAQNHFKASIENVTVNAKVSKELQTFLANPPFESDTTYKVFQPVQKRYATFARKAKALEIVLFQAQKIGQQAQSGATKEERKKASAKLANLQGRIPRLKKDVDTARGNLINQVADYDGPGADQLKQIVSPLTDAQTNLEATRAASTAAVALEETKTGEDVIDVVNKNKEVFEKALPQAQRTFQEMGVRTAEDAAKLSAARRKLLLAYTYAAATLKTTSTGPDGRTTIADDKEMQRTFLAQASNLIQTGDPAFSAKDLVDINQKQQQINAHRARTSQLRSTDKKSSGPRAFREKWRKLLRDPEVSATDKMGIISNDVIPDADLAIGQVNNPKTKDGIAAVRNQLASQVFGEYVQSGEFDQFFPRAIASWFRTAKSADSMDRKLNNVHVITETVTDPETGKTKQVPKTFIFKQEGGRQVKDTIPAEKLQEMAYPVYKLFYTRAVANGNVK